MTFKTQMTTDLSVFFNGDEFAETVTYSGTDITGVVEYGEDPNETADGNVTKAKLHVKVSDVAAPAYRDSVVIGSDTWYVRNVMEGDGVVWILNIQKDERPVW